MNKLIEYLGEFRLNPRPIAAALAGMAGGPALINYLISLFLPHLVKEFGWDRADLALMGTAGIVVLIVVPIYGRLADLIGVRMTALIGIIGLPLSIAGFAFMNGDIRVYFVLWFAANILGSAGTTAIYTRLVAARFDKARGLALAIVISAGAGAVAIFTPIVQNVIETEGWRTGFLTVAGIVAVLGGLAFFLVPHRRTEKTREGGASLRATVQDYSVILTALPFWIVFGGMFLCNIPSNLQQSQLVLVMVEKGLSTGTAAAIFSFYATGVIVGRLITGFSLDRAPPHIVAAIGMVLPAIGLFALGWGVNSTPAVAASIIIMGMSQGAESDMMGFMTARYFKIELYSSTLGLIYVSIGLASTVGSVILSTMLSASGNYTSFLLLSGCTVVVGASAFLLLGRFPALRPAHA